MIRPHPLQLTLAIPGKIASTAQRRETIDMFFGRVMRTGELPQETRTDDRIAAE
jgi:hypothetical protein